MTGLCDSLQRPINYLRVSVTDRCNLRCIYCMPTEGVSSVPDGDILSYEEICTVVEAAASLGINKVRLTGGEPLVRADLTNLVKMLAQIEGIDDISLTTNGVLLAKYATELKSNGLQRVNVSLDTLQKSKYRLICQHGNISDVLKGIEIARSVDLNPVKINMVVMHGINDDEIVDFANKTITEGWHVRFIEHMPFMKRPDTTLPFVSVREMKTHLTVLGRLEPASIPGDGPAKYFRLPRANGTIGFITPVSRHFCSGCNRLRLTSDGQLRPCLLNNNELNIRETIRNGASINEVKRLIQWAAAGKWERHNVTSGHTLEGRPMCQVGG